MHKHIDTDELPAGGLVRPLDERHVARLMDSIKKFGFLANFPLAVTDGGDLYDGSHRAEAARRLDLPSVPVMVTAANGKPPVRLALESNLASETAKPMNFVDHAEMIWRLIGEGKTQQAVADELGWSRDKVARYSALQAIDTRAWTIVTASVRDEVRQQNPDVTDDVTTVTPFTEGLLRVLIPLSAEARAKRASPGYAALSREDQVAAWAAARQPAAKGEPDYLATLRVLIEQASSQQCELCRMLVRGKDDKGHRFEKADFTLRAQIYRARNALEQIGWEMICSAVPAGEKRDEYWADFREQIGKAIYTDEYFEEVVGRKASEARRAPNEFWQLLVEEGTLRPGSKLEALIAAYVADYEDQMKARIIVGDFREVGAQIADESIDAIVTDPPYEKDAVELFEPLAQFALRVLKPGGSCIVLCGQTYLLDYFDALRKHLDYHWTLCIDMPGGQAVQQHDRGINIFWKPALWFAKGRIKSAGISDVIRPDANNNDKRYHHWGQSEQMMRGLVERCSMPGNVILDPMMGGGTTGVVCRLTNRDFIGIEIDEAMAKKAQERIAAAAK